MLKEWCPQCKAPFSYLYTHRHLDGTPSDYPIEEGVTLLKRARWFVEEMEAREKAKQQATEARRLLAADAAQVAAAATERDDTDRYHAAGDGAGVRACVCKLGWVGEWVGLWGLSGLVFML